MSIAATTPLPADWRDFVALTKPRVMSLVVFTGLCGYLVAPVQLPFALAFTAILSIALGAGAAAALNQWYEADLDSRMKRTARRPLPDGRMAPQSALHFGVGLSAFSVVLLGLAANWVAAAILALSIVYYAVVYTIWLKPRTPQNIVIGGGAGAFPPVIGWAAATGDVTLLPALMFAIIFLWTPPHFWALALFVKTDYAKAGIPMLPVVAGEAETRRQIGYYTLALIAAAILPWPLELTGPIYGWGSVLLSALFGLCAWRVVIHSPQAGDPMAPEKALFAFSILWLFALFALFVVDVRLLL